MSERVEAIQWAAANAALMVEEQRGRPSMLLRPQVFPDGNQWCALYGDNIQDGVAGFGDTPDLAYADFDRNWTRQRILGGAP